MEGWCSIEDLTQWAFGHAPVVMANEAHSGLTRCIRTREVGVRIIQEAHQAGVRRLAMEALPRRVDNSPGPIPAIPRSVVGYLAQPDMRRLITTALDLGWSLWAYEAKIDPGKDPAELVSTEFTNWREREQARNLCQLLAAAPGEPLLVWCGNGHASKHADREWVPMGCHFAAMSGIQQFVIDQALTVDFTGEGPEPWVRELLAALSDTLAAYGGTIGILRDQAPPPLDCLPGVDAIVVSTENTLT
ncbi:MAG TPA: hypothetical protein VME19_14515 [Streptosporangiaceae bacterium]|nr:hypothetical protein [Streptosporangiaceae bacterium]